MWKSFSENQNTTFFKHRGTSFQQLNRDPDPF